MKDERRKPGPKPSGKAKTAAQRQKEYRRRQAEKVALYESWLLENGPALPHPSKIDRFED